MSKKKVHFFGTFPILNWRGKQHWSDYGLCWTGKNHQIVMTKDYEKVTCLSCRKVYENQHRVLLEFNREEIERMLSSESRAITVVDGIRFVTYAIRE